MSTLVGLQEARAGWESPIAERAKPLDEAVWQAWLANGRARDRGSRATSMKAVKWVAIAGLLVAAGLSTLPAPYDIVVRFIVAASAIIMMLHAFQARHYAFVPVFGALALLYNPVVLVFSFSGDWQRALVAASAIPFLASLAWRNMKVAHND